MTKIKLKVKKLHQQNRTRKNGPIKKYETARSVWKRYRSSKIRNIIALAQKWKFETGKRKLAVSSTGAKLKHQLG